MISQVFHKVTNLRRVNYFHQALNFWSKVIYLLEWHLVLSVCLGSHQLLFWLNSYIKNTTVQSCATSVHINKFVDSLPTLLIIRIKALGKSNLNPFKQN